MRAFGVLGLIVLLVALPIGAGADETPGAVEVALAGVHAARTGAARTLDALADWPAVREALLGPDADAAGIDVEEVRATVLAFVRHARPADPSAVTAALASARAGVTATADGDRVEVRIPAPVDAVVTCRRVDGEWRLTAWDQLPRSLFLRSEDPRARAHLRFLRTCTQLPDVSPGGAVIFDGELRLNGALAGTLWIGIEPAQEGGLSLWRIEEVLRIDGGIQSRREGLFSATLYPVRGVVRTRVAGRDAERVSRWRGDGRELVVERDGAAVLRAPFAGSAVVGVGPLLLLGRHLRDSEATLLATTLYDAADAPIEVASQEVRSAPPEPDAEVSTLRVTAREPGWLSFDGTSGVLLRIAYESAVGRLLAQPRHERTAEPTVDVFTRDPTTPALAVTQFLHALQRLDFTRAATLVAWSRIVPGELPAAKRGEFERAWLEMRRMELRRAPAPLPDDTVLRGVHAVLREHDGHQETIKLELPRPYAEWSVELARDADHWGIFRVRPSASDSR